MQDKGFNKLMLTRKFKANELQAISWIQEQLKQPTRQLKMPGVIINDLNYSLALNLQRLQQEQSAETLASYNRTKRIKDFLNSSK
jgi:hypothetical protein